MIWEDEFYKIEEIVESDNGFKAIVELKEKHYVYDGHFPNEPIVPGVCTLSIVRKCLRIYTDRNVSFYKIKECKFLSVLKPSHGLLTTIDVKLINDDMISAIVYNDDKIVLKLKSSIK